MRKDPYIEFIGKRPIVMRWNPDGNLSTKRQGLSDVSDVSDVDFSDPGEKNNSTELEGQKDPKTVSNMDTNEDIHVVPETQPGFEGSATIEGGSQKVMSLTSLTSPRIYKASWTGDVWACRYCGLKGEKQSLLENHDCSEIKVKEEN